MMYQVYRGQLEIKTRAQPYTCRTLDLIEVFGINNNNLCSSCKPRVFNIKRRAAESH